MIWPTVYAPLYSHITRKERIRNVTIRQRIVLEETIIKETEQNQLTWYSHVQRIALKWMPKQKTARGRPKKSWMEGIRKAMNERNLSEGQWEDRKQRSLGVGQRRKAFWNRCMDGWMVICVPFIFNIIRKLYLSLYTIPTQGLMDTFWSKVIIGGFQFDSWKRKYCFHSQRWEPLQQQHSVTSKET